MAASHLMLLAGILWGGMPYLALQILLAVELVVINLASIALYPSRGLSEGGTTFVAMVLMIFVAIFVAVPLLTLLDWFGLAVGVDQLLACLMVAVRGVLALVTASFSEREMSTMAANPYLS